MSDKTPGQLATRYLMERWRATHGTDTPPLELASAVVKTVNVCGYSRKLVDNMIAAYDTKDQAGTS